jgi:hypothetical protein
MRRVVMLLGVMGIIGLSALAWSRMRHPHVRVSAIETMDMGTTP